MLFSLLPDLYESTECSKVWGMDLTIWRWRLPSEFSFTRRNETANPTIMPPSSTSYLNYRNEFGFIGGRYMSGHRTMLIVLAALLLFVVGMSALDGAQPSDSKTAQEEAQTAKANEIADRIFYREAKFIQDLKPFTPMVETYIQNMK